MRKLFSRMVTPPASCFVKKAKIENPAAKNKYNGLITGPEDSLNFNKKMIVLNKIKEVERVLGIYIPVFSISINHFHLKFSLEDGRLMTKLKTILHSGISREYRKIYHPPYEQFWQSTKTSYLEDEEDSWKTAGYIIGNLLKHREVSTLKELKENPFSAYSHFVNKYGEEIN